jgi:O-antigen ligase
MTLTSPRDCFRRFLAGTAILAIFTAIMIFAVDFHVGKLSNFSWGGGRVGLFGLDPISISLPLGIAGVVLAHYFLSSGRFAVKVSAFLAATLVFYSVFPTGTRQTILCMAIAILTYVWLAFRSYFGKTLGVVVMLMIIVAGFVGVTGHYKNERFDVNKKGYFQNQSFLDRIKTMKRGLNTFSESPILGAGTGGHGIDIYITNPYTNERSRDKEHIHNLFVELLAEQGILGFILFLVPLMIVIVRMMKCINKTKDKNLRQIYSVTLALVAFVIVQSNISGGLAVSGSIIVELVAWMSVLTGEMTLVPGKSNSAVEITNTQDGICYV